MKRLLAIVLVLLCGVAWADDKEEKAIEDLLGRVQIFYGDVPDTKLLPCWETATWASQTLCKDGNPIEFWAGEDGSVRWRYIKQSTERKAE